MATSISDEVNPSLPLDQGADTPGDDYSYRAVSRTAVLSLVFGLLGQTAWFFPELVVLCAIGLIFAVVAFRSLRRFPTELSGMPVAVLGAVVSLIALIVVPIQQTYTYYTELPEGYERISFFALTSPMGAPDQPPPSALELNGKKVFLKGYIHLTSMPSNSAKTFILVPDLATCCFGKQPPLTHMIEVRLSGEQFAQKSLRRHSLAGTLQVRPFIKPIEGLQGVYYELEADVFR
jgi:hypothetical protein